MVSRFEENLKEHYVLARPLKESCKYHDKRLAVHEDEFEDVFRLYCTACDESHEFEYSA